MTAPTDPPVAIVDDMFPRLRAEGSFSGRKHAEYTGLMQRLERSLALCPASGALAESDHADAVRHLARNLPLDPGRFVHGSAPEAVRGGLAYTVFPHRALKYLPYLEHYGLRFVTTVYPGGGFLMWGPKEAESLARLNTLAAHPLFRGFVVHHEIIRDYLAEKLPQAPLHVFDGGFSQIDPDLLGPRTYFGRDRTTLNLCFMANRYDPLGLGKGFDVFLEAARLASRRFPDTAFHVVGDWPQDESAGVRPGDPVTFHGYVAATALPAFFADIDIIVSPTRIDIPVPGKYDGFPLVIDASVCGVAICATDPLSQNRHYRDGLDLWIIEPRASDVVEIIDRVLQAPPLLEQVAVNGMRITRQSRDYNAKIQEKAALLRSLAAAR